MYIQTTFTLIEPMNLFDIFNLLLRLLLLLLFIALQHLAPDSTGWSLLREIIELTM